MAKIKGKDLKITFSESGYAIGCARSCDVTISNEVIEIASPDSGQYNEYIKGRTGWSLSVSCLIGVGNEGQLLSISSADSLTATFSIGSGKTLTGKVICTQIKYTGTIGNLAQASASFQGSGELTEG